MATSTRLIHYEYAGEEFVEPYNPTLLGDPMVDVLYYDALSVAEEHFGNPYYVVEDVPCTYGSDDDIPF